MWWLTDHEEPTRQGSRHRQNAPYQRMRTADGYLMIGAAGESIWVRCAEALGHTRSGATTPALRQPGSGCRTVGRSKPQWKPC